MSFARDFAKVFGFLAVLGGLYVGARAGNLEWIFWVCVAAASLIAGLRWLLPRAIEVATRVRNYPALLRHSAELQDQVTRQEEESRRQAEQATDRYEDGLEEGRREFAGAFLAGLAADVPSITGIASADKAAVLIGQVPPGTPVLPGARYLVRVASTGETRGVVEVEDGVRESGLVRLQCVRSDVRAFWDALAARVETDASPPPDVELAKAPYPQPENVDWQVVAALVRRQED